MGQRHPTGPSSLCSVGENCSSLLTNHHHQVKTSKLLYLPGHVPTQPTHLQPHLFPTVDVPDHAHYIIGSVILLVGVTGMLGNALVIYVFCRSRTLRSPSNLLVVNLAAADFLMSLTQSPVFFVASLHRRWVFGEVACELYAFCGALFGITSMMTLTAIAVDRCLAITRPLALLGGVSRQRVLAVLAGVWFYSLGWSLPPFFGWSAYVPEGLQTSCSWDYMSFTATVRTYTILLFAFVFFVPLALIAGCYFAIFRAVRRAGQEVEQLSCGETNKAYERLRSEWRLAKVALGVILLFIVSWSPYSAVALTATAGYAHLLTPYMNSVPAIIAKASAIHNPIIYAITHPKYRAAIGRHIPLLRTVLRLQEKDLRSSFSSSGASSRRATLTSQSSPGGRLGPGVRTNGRWGKSSLSSASDSESCWTESEADGSSTGSTALNRQVFTDVTADTKTTSSALLSQNRRHTADTTSPAAPDAESPDGGAVTEGKPLLLPL
ncbi:melanopsin-like [Lates calcarifer]|uniref:Melanopsin-like n=1 Tax=Lates calcarifer TaxID=8187 RepID=A0A4W6CLG6_LATCA|nr:melanopsin-like [Lates calcarifer]XP_050925731.1 melanopsin-like [Lates calcarifer]